MNATSRSTRPQALQQQLQQALDGAELGSWMFNCTSGSWAHRAPRHDQLFGYETAQARWDWSIALRHVPVEDRPVLSEAFANAARTGRLLCEFRVLWPDGEFHWIVLQARAVGAERSRGTRLAGVAADITPRKAALEAVHKRDAHLTALYEQIGAGLCESDLSGHFLRVNDRYCAIVGRSREELLGLRMQQITHPEDLPRNLVLFQRLVTLGEPFTVEKRYVRPDGSAVWVSNTVGLLRLAGEPARAIAVTLDVTQQRQAERTLADLSATLDLASVFVRDLDGTIRHWSRGCQQLYGWTAQEAVGRSAHELLHTIFPLLLPQLEATLEREGEWTGDLRQTTRSGQAIVVTARKALRRDDQGRPVAVADAITDVTAARQTQAALVRSIEESRVAAQRLQLALAAGAVVGTWLWELPADAFTVDERFAQSFGIDPVLGCTGLSLKQLVAAVHPQDLPGLHAAFAEALGHGGACSHECRVRGRDGDFRWRQLNGRGERAEDGTVLRFSGVLLDVEQRRALEVERDEATRLLRAFTEAVPGAVYAKDRQGRMLVANRVVTELVGKPLQALLGKTDLEFLDDKVQARVVMDNDHRIMDSGQPEQVEETLSGPDGTPAVWLSTKAPFRDAQGHIIGIIGASLPFTERKAAEGVLAELNATLEQRVAMRTLELAAARDAAEGANRAKSDFLATMSHEIRTPLNAVIGLSYLLKQTQLNDRQRLLIANVNNAGEQLLSIVNDVLDLSKIEAGEMKLESLPLEIRTLAQQSMAFVEMPAAQKNLALLLQVDPDVPLQLIGDPTRLKQILVNLLSNAVKFTQTGSVTLRVQPLQTADPASEDAAHWMVLRFEVEDTGIGIPASKQAAIFKPFTQADTSTTRRFGGTGLGLSIVQRLVEMMGGYIDVNSTLGQGSTFSVKVPLRIN